MDRSRKMWELAETYHEKTEAFDRIICSGSVKNGSVWPANVYEFRMVNKNANNVHRSILEEASKYDITAEEMQNAIFVISKSFRYSDD